MLQQTQVERVIPLYEAFVARWPSFAALAAADAGDVVRAWRGLGYNSRAVRLHALARAVVERHGGALPAELGALRALPGIGAYTAAAVRAFAFERDDAAMDVNLRRVVHRVRFGLEHPPLADERALDTLALAAVPPGAAHDWNSALMDLGATLCTARAPKCLVCPLRERAPRRRSTRTRWRSAPGARQAQAAAERHSVRAHDAFPARPNHRPLARRPAARDARARRARARSRRAGSGRPLARDTEHRGRARARRYRDAHRTAVRLPERALRPIRADANLRLTGDVFTCQRRMVRFVRSPYVHSPANTLR